jgi:hypothetical protein
VTPETPEITPRGEREQAEREQLFDETIQPAIQALAELCERLGMALSLAVEVEQNNTSYVFTKDPAGVTMETAMIRSAIIGAPNLDRVVFNILDFCKKNNVDTSTSLVATAVSGMRAQ